MNRDASNLLERMLVLRALPAFSKLEEDSLAGIARRAQEQVLEAGTVLQRAGHAVRRVWVVVEGRLRVEDEAHRVTRSEGRVGFGILRMVAEAPAPHTVVVDTRSRLLMLEQDSLRDLMDEDFTVLAHVLRFLSDEIVETYEALDVDYEAPEVPRPVPEQLQQERPLDLVERLLAIRQVPAFGRSSLDSVARYASLLEERCVPAGQRLWTEGEAGSAYVHLVSGTLLGRREQGQGRLVFHSPTMPGLFGVLSTREHRWYTATAETDLVLLEVDRETLLDLLEDDSEMASFCLKRTARRLLGFLSLRDDRATRNGRRDR